MYHKCANCFLRSSLAYFGKELASLKVYSCKVACKMEIRLWKSCASIVALSICFPITYAFLGIESLSTEWSHVVDLYERNDARWFANGDSIKEEKKEETEKRNCTNASINEFPTDLFTAEERHHGAVLLHAFLGVCCFLMTAFVCHDYLLPSVDRICVKLNISTDIAGATFLAMASSFPEMFVNVIGTFLTESDLGAGTVVGSAVFDTFATPACGALLAVHAIPLEWQILSRDCSMYVISVATLVVVIWDGLIRWYEAVILIALLCCYLILLFCGKNMKRCCCKVTRVNCVSATKLANAYENSTLEGSYKSRGENDVAITDRPVKLKVGELESQRNETVNSGNEKNSEKLEEHSMAEYLFRWPTERSILAKCWFAFTWPLKFLLFVTIPDARLQSLKHWYPLTFIMCVIWIAIISYLVSWMMTVVGDTIGIPDSIMGLTFLAAGGNMPELASIVILAKHGEGNMAMSNTLGANILDILLCLGLPWTIRCLMTGEDVKIVSGALSYSVLSIVVCIAVLYGVLAFFKFKLNRKVGWICLLVYAIFLIFATLVELNVFYPVNLPICR